MKGHVGREARERQSLQLHMCWVRMCFGRWVHRFEEGIMHPPTGLNLTPLWNGVSRHVSTACMLIPSRYIEGGHTCMHEYIQ